MGLPGSEAGGRGGAAWAFYWEEGACGTWVLKAKLLVGVQTGTTLWKANWPEKCSPFDLESLAQGNDSKHKKGFYTKIFVSRAKHCKWPNYLRRVDGSTQHSCHL